MDWSAQVDGYCERLDPSFWSEPVNAVTNLAFILAAVLAGRKLPGSGLIMGWVLVAILFAIGVGSFLFHTFATRWAGAMDTGPILIFILTYTFVATRDLLGRSGLMAGIVTLAFFPFAGLAYPIGVIAPWLESSAGYVPVLLWIGGYALLTRGALARDFWTVFALLALSITFRSLDMRVCEHVPVGTHFLWHILNAVLLGYLINMYRRHMLAGQAPQG